MKRLAAAVASMLILTGVIASPAAAEPPRPGVWWIVPRSATITQGDYPRPTAWTLDGVEYGVADNGHLYADGVDLGTPAVAECTTAPATVVVQQAPRLRAKVQELRARVRHLRAQLRAAR